MKYVQIVSIGLDIDSDAFLQFLLLDDKEIDPEKALRDIMRLEIVIILVSIGLFVAEETRSSRSNSHFVKHRTKPRAIRGFKPEFLSTAIGFGKRESALELSKQDRREKIILDLLQKFPQSVPLEWFFYEMRRNPELAKQIAAKIINGDHNGKISTAEYFNPERTVSIL